jgi:hypothetical protein
MRHKHIWLMALCFLALMLALPALAQDAPGPVDTVRQFYEAYMAEPAARAGGHHGSPYLTAALIERIDTILSDATNNYDPILCAQDVPERIEAKLLDQWDDSGLVMMSAYFAGNPRSRSFAVDVVREGDAWKLDSIACYDRVTPQGATELFYNSYTAAVLRRQLAASAAADRAYQELAFMLAPALVDRLNALYDAGPIMADPLMCAQELPDRSLAETLSQNEGAASVLVNARYGGMSFPHRFIVELESAGIEWVIADVTCEVGPAEVAAAFYNVYAAYARYDMDTRSGRTTLVDWGFAWADYLSMSLLTDLQSVFASGAPRIADPVVCAQDLPDYFETETLEAGPDTASVLVRGAYASGPGTFNSYDLAVVEMDSGQGGWLIADITCQTGQRGN